MRAIRGEFRDKHLADAGFKLPAERNIAVCRPGDVNIACRIKRYRLAPQLAHAVVAGENVIIPRQIELRVESSIASRTLHPVIARLEGVRCGEQSWPCREPGNICIPGGVHCNC